MATLVDRETHLEVRPHKPAQGTKTAPKGILWDLIQVDFSNQQFGS